MRRVFEHHGLLLVSGQLNLRIHTTLPDCWRFTEHSFTTLLRDLRMLELNILKPPTRNLFPLRYNVLAENDKLMTTEDSPLVFRFIE